MLLQLLIALHPSLPVSLNGDLPRPPFLLVPHLLLLQLLGLLLVETDLVEEVNVVSLSGLKHILCSLLGQLLVL